MEISPEVYNKVEALAKEAGISTPMALGIILEAQVEEYQKREESIRNIVTEVLDEHYHRLAAPFELELQRLQEFNELLMEIFPQVRRTLQKKAQN
jgi:hypothetical protein